jgi:hypothetical protein
MARGTTLGDLVNQLRIAAKLDPNPALSINLVPSMKRELAYTQERLYDEFDWPHLKITRDKELQAGERHYDVPDDMNLERIIAVDVRWGGRWLPVERGIGLDQYNQHDSDADIRVDPVLRWDVKDTGTGAQIEIWPVPLTDYDAESKDGALRFTGIRQLNQLVANSDRADLDDQMVVKYVAASMLASRKDADAQVKLAEARSRKKTLQGRITKTRRNSFGLGTGRGDCASRPGSVRVAYVR